MPSKTERQGPLPWGESRRDFKKRMRAGAKATLQTMDEWQTGIAYIPSDAYQDFKKAQELVADIAKRLSVKEWGR